MAALQSPTPTLNLDVFLSAAQLSKTKAVYRRLNMASNLKLEYSRYSYWRFQSGVKFRLLKFSLAENGCFMVGQLIEHDVADGVQYDCLSYTWGTDLPKHVIILDGAALPITWNLQQALNYLRQVQKTGLVWIGTICLCLNRHRTKYRENLRFRALFSEVFRLLPITGFQATLIFCTCKWLLLERFQTSCLQSPYAHWLTKRLRSFCTCLVLP